MIRVWILLWVVCLIFINWASAKDATADSNSISGGSARSVSDALAIGGDALSRSRAKSMSGEARSEANARAFMGTSRAESEAESDNGNLETVSGVEQDRDDGIVVKSTNTVKYIRGDGDHYDNFNDK